MLEIPLTPYPNKVFEILLDEQECIFHLFQRGKHMYMDVTVNGGVILTGAICLDRSNIFLNPTSKFEGKLYFIDIQGETDPQWEGLGDRYRCIYFSENEAVLPGLI